MNHHNEEARRVADAGLQESETGAERPNHQGTILRIADSEIKPLDFDTRNIDLAGLQPVEVRKDGMILPAWFFVFLDSWLCRIWAMLKPYSLILLYLLAKHLGLL